MKLRFAGMITGCMLVGASAAAYHRADSRPAPSGATLATATPELPTPLLVQAATGAPTSAAWPPVTTVAFYQEMFEQLPAATAPVTPAQAETPPAAPRVIPLPRAPQTPPMGTAYAGTGGAPTPPPGNINVAAGGGQTPPAIDSNAEAGGQPTPQRAGGAPPNADMVEIVIRDRFGRPIRVERVERRRHAAARAHQPPPPYRFYHSYPQGPHGGYGPYGLHR